MKKLKWIPGVFISILLFIVFVKAIKNPSSSYDKWLPTNTQFANEPIPLEVVDVRERLDRELLVNANWHSNTYLILKRAHRAFPIIEPILRKHGVPDDFKYLAVIESGLVNAVSPAGARGVWQFMPNTAKEFGLEVSATVDERYDLQKSTEAACKYLLQAKEKFGNWTLAAASYNAGIQGIASKLSSQLVNNYYDLYLAEETSRYVFRIIAIKHIMENPEQYNFVLTDDQKYYNPPTDKVEINISVDNLAEFAQLHGTNYKQIKLLNPWLRDTKLANPDKKTYWIEIPKK